MCTMCVCVGGVGSSDFFLLLPFAIKLPCVQITMAEGPRGERKTKGQRDSGHEEQVSERDQEADPHWHLSPAGCFFLLFGVWQFTCPSAWAAWPRSKMSDAISVVQAVHLGSTGDTCASFPPNALRMLAIHATHCPLPHGWWGIGD